MIPLYEIGIIKLGVIASFSMILTAIAIFLLINTLILRLGKILTICALVATSIILIFTQSLAELAKVIEKGKGFSLIGKAVGDISINTTFIIFMVFLIIDILLMTAFLEKKKNMLTSDAIKQSFDVLPEGICFSEPNGYPLLINVKMVEIWSKVFEEKEMNEKVCYAMLLEGKINKRIQILRKTPTIILRDGDTVWDIHRIRHEDAVETIVYDISEEYGLNYELETRKQKLSEINKRLKRYNKDVKNITREKEILAAKMRIHNDMGQFLLALKLELTQDKKEKYGELMALWKYTVAVLRNEIKINKKGEDLEDLMLAASALGIKIKFMGELPENSKVKDVILKAAFECMTNTARHAGGDETYVKIEDKEEVILCAISNNGKAPEGDIKETGGLANLRNSVEAIGGNMVVEVTPEFILKIEFLKGKAMIWEE